MSRQFTVWSRSVFRLISILWTMLFTACDGPKADYSKVDLVRAHGLVKLDGKPLEGAVIRFEDEVDQTFSYGVTNLKGEFKLKFDSEMDGVKLGKKVVRISMNQQVLGANASPSEEGEDPDAKPVIRDPIPERYNTKSELVCVVEKGKTRYDFNLTSSKSRGSK